MVVMCAHYNYLFRILALYLGQYVAHVGFAMRRKLDALHSGSVHVISHSPVVVWRISIKMLYITVLHQWSSSH